MTRSSDRGTGSRSRISSTRSATRCRPTRRARSSRSRLRISCRSSSRPINFRLEKPNSARTALRSGRSRSSLPTRAPASAAAGPAPTFPVTGTLNQVMRGILFPSSNVLFDVQTKDPGAGSKGGIARPDAAATSTRYGDVYAPWMVVDAAAISIAEIGPVLMQPGRRCENGKPVPVARADWKQYVQGVVEAGRAAYRASQSRSQDAVSDATNRDLRRVRELPPCLSRCAKRRDALYAAQLSFEGRRSKFEAIIPPGSFPLSSPRRYRWLVPSPDTSSLFWC